MPAQHVRLRLLNGSHSAIAYLGLLAGHETVSDAFADPAIRRFVDGLWAEAAPTLPSGAGLDPHISEAGARYQAARVAEARGLDRARVETLIREAAYSPGDFLTQDRIVNVLVLNLALDGL